MRTAALILIAGLLLVGSASAAGGDGRDGRYEGRVPANNAIDRAEIAFDVTRNGRRIERWRTSIATICSYPPYVEVETYPMVMPTIEVRRDGRFRRVFKRKFRGSDARLEVSGRLKGRRVVNGRLDYSVGVCVRGADWRAKRAGRG